MKAPPAALLLGSAVLVLTCATADADPAADRAALIVRASGVAAGFAVHVGVTDGKLTAALGEAGRFVVHGVANERAAVETARKHIRATGKYGAVSVDVAGFGQLPYADNVANLVVVDDVAKLIRAGLSLTEVRRILCPGGVAVLGGADPAAVNIADCTVKTTADGWVTLTKSPPAGVDEWPQWQHDAARSQTSGDRLVGPPRHLKWIDGPRRSRNHKDHPWAAVSANGRNFIVYDDGPRFYTAPDRRVLVCRDAYNGLELWRRALPPVRKKPRYGAPFHVATLCAAGDRVYAAMRYRGPLVEMDAATGKTLRTFEQAPTAVWHLGETMLMTGGGPLRKMDIKTGKLVWTAEIGGRGTIVLGGEIFTQLGKHAQAATVVCLDLETGRETWRRKHPQLAESTLCRGGDGVLLFAGGEGGTLQVLSAKDGAYLWSHRYRVPGHGGSPRNVFLLGQMVWVRDAGEKTKKPARKIIRPEAWLGFDAASGELKRRIPGQHVQKCCADAATVDYLLCGTMDFVDWRKGENRASRAVRNVCRFGFLVANGMVYTFPTDCGCYPLLRGSLGLTAASDKPRPPGGPAKNVLVRGPAWGSARGKPAGPEDWPVYRGTPQRGGSTPSEVPQRLTSLWSVRIGGRLSAATVAAGKLFVSAIDAHQVHALDAADGKRLWTYTTGGRVDTPPTYHDGRLLFGCRDGWVYCLRAADGELIWRRRAAPADRRIIAYGQPESLWPVHGSVLIDGGVAFVAAGRHTGLDGGIFLYALDPATGRIRWKTQPPGDTFADLLVKSGGVFHMNYAKFDPKTGANPRTSSSRDVFLHAGRSSTFLDDTYAYRTRWSLRHRIGGHLVSFDRTRAVAASVIPFVEGYHQKYAWTQPGRGDHKLYAKPTDGPERWRITLPLRPRAMVMTPETVLIAGPPDAQPPVGGILAAYAMTDGSQRTRIALDASPVFDGLAVAAGRAYLCLTNGHIHCFGAR